MCTATVGSDVSTPHRQENSYEQTATGRAAPTLVTVADEPITAKVGWVLVLAKPNGNA